MTAPIKIVLRVDAAGRGSTIVDGLDVSNHIAGLAVESNVNTGTHVRLDFVNVEVELEGTVDLTAMGSEWATYRLGKVIRDEMQAAAAAEGAKA